MQHESPDWLPSELRTTENLYSMAAKRYSKAQLRNLLDAEDLLQVLKACLLLGRLCLSRARLCKCLRLVTY